jgi:hypothetical protein
MFSNAKTMSPQAALLIVQHSRPYIIQRRDFSEDLWEVVQLPDVKAPQVFKGKYRAYDKMKELKREFPRSQFRTMPKPEADMYEAGIRDAMRTTKAHEASSHHRQNRPRVMYLPDNL